MNKMKFESPDMTAKNIDKIAELFPNCITETTDEDGKLKKAINFDMLRAMLSEDIAEGDEAYEFTWVGKKAAIAEAHRPIRKTLRPCPEESKNRDTTENLYIEGDNLEVLKLLQESYLGKIKMIYIDPPYNTGNDFIYRDDFAMDYEEYAKESGQLDEEDNRLFKNTDSNGRFHSDWCSMIYSRLMLARNLLTDDGVIFISIDDNEQENLKKICDEVFGAENFVCDFVRKNKAGSGHDSARIAIEFDYILCYTKEINNCKFNQENIDTTLETKYKLEDEFVSRRGKYYLRDLDYRGSYSESLDYPIEAPDGTILYSGGEHGRPNTWRWSKQKVEWGLKNGFIVFAQKPSGWKVYIKQYQFVDNNDKPYVRTIPYRALIDFSNGLGSTECTELLGSNIFSYPKPSALIKHLCNIATQEDSLILDFFSGSATTAHAVMQLNAEDGGHRKFIMVQLPEETDENSEAFKAGYKNICEIGKERIRRAGKKIVDDLNAKAEIKPGQHYPLDSEEILWSKYEPQIGDQGVKKFTFSDVEGQNQRTESNNLKYLRSPEKLDIGFRVLKLDDTNMKDVYYSAGEYNQDMLADLESNIKDDRTDLDLLFGCLLDWGLMLSKDFFSEKIDGATVYTYDTSGARIALIACFEENIPDAVVKAIAKRQPLRAVFRDSSFNSSPEKINLGEIFKLLSPDTTVKVI